MIYSLWRIIFILQCLIVKTGSGQILIHDFHCIYVTYYYEAKSANNYT